MQRNAPCLWLLTCVFVFTCTRRSAATNASNTGTIDSPCTACVLTAYDGRALYVYASTEASVQAYDVHYLQITLEGIHPTAGGAPHELRADRADRRACAARATAEQPSSGAVTFTTPEACVAAAAAAAAARRIEGRRIGGDDGGTR